MSVYSMYFSPTGGVEKVLDVLLAEITLDTSIDLSKHDKDYSAYHFEKEDICFIGVPVFGGRVAPTAIERVKQTQADGALAIIVAVFGNRAYDDALLELKNEAIACGFEVGAAIAANAEHSIVRHFGTQRPDTTDKKELSNYANQIKDVIRHRKSLHSFEVPGNYPYKEYKGVPIKPKATKACIECGICAEQCPVQAISIDNPSSLDKEKCISCMRCIAVCPVQARKLNRMLLAAAEQGMKKSCTSRKVNEIYT
ncbi:EFR1 family ferrodoxin [Enterococcus sp. AZ196]|uniref:EFR1 family ferrodoxin n=1 Tax=Enterococcus sp. AZ196 TaxID=2774659 RepID=UPI003D287F16